MPRPEPHRLEEYPPSRVRTTRWMDNDPYGHMNNVVYYSLFDTLVNAWLIEHGALDVEKGGVVGFVVEAGCRPFSPPADPQPVTPGIRGGPMGRSSVRYELALFGKASPTAAAQGHFVHVYVEREGRRPVRELPAALQAALKPLLVPSPAKEE